MFAFLDSMQLRSRRLVTTTALFVGAAVVCVGILLALSGSSASARRAHTNPRAFAAIADPVTLGQHYGILGQSSPSSLTPLPTSGGAGQRIAHLQSLFGLDLSQARMAEGPNGTMLWLIPGSGGVCMAEEKTAGYAGAACGSDIPPSGFIGKWGSDPSGQSLVGFVADGNATVTITLADGSTMSAPVVNNAVFAQTTNSNGFEKMQVTDPSGSADAVAVNIPPAP